MWQGWDLGEGSSPRELARGRVSGFQGGPSPRGDGTGVAASGHKWGPGTGPETKPEVSGLTKVQRFPASLPC